MRVSVLGVAALLASTSLGSADDIMAGYYGNTLVATTAESQIHIHYRADHTFDASGTDAAGPIAFKGMWTPRRPRPIRSAKIGPHTPSATAGRYTASRSP
jgi:hypothetical protein